MENIELSLYLHFHTAYMYKLIRLPHRWQYTRQFWININFVQKKRLLILIKPHNKTGNDFLNLYGYNIDFMGVGKNLKIPMYLLFFLYSLILWVVIFFAIRFDVYCHIGRVSLVCFGKGQAKFNACKVKVGSPRPSGSPSPRIGRL